MKPFAKKHDVSITVARWEHPSKKERKRVARLKKVIKRMHRHRIKLKIKEI